MTTFLKSSALRASFAFACILVFSQYSLGQSNQYKRPKKSTASGSAVSSGAPVAAPKSGTATAPAKDEKVDIKEIEQQYWSSKDTEFKVVQNRRYTKEKRFYVSGGAGSLIGDENSTGYVYNLGMGYYLTEQYGVELMYNKFDTESAKALTKLENQATVTVNHNEPDSFMGAAFIWSPVYAKLSILDSHIIYFDMSISPVLGMSWQRYHQRYDPKLTDPYFTVGIDIAQHFYIDDHFAVKFDFRNRFFNEETRNWNNNPLTPGSDFEVGDNSRIITTLNVGVEYFF